MKVMHERATNTLLFHNPEASDFLSPASQEVIRRWKRPLWPGIFTSRCTNFPMWERSDLFRTISYSDTVDLNFSSPKVEFPSAVIGPSSRLCLDKVERIVTIQPSDKDLYSPDAQRIFSLFCQFDTLVTEQISAFTSISLGRVEEVCHMFYLTGILRKPRNPWKHGHLSIYRIDLWNHSTISYEAGMDAIAQLVTTGGHGMSKPPLGSGTRSATRHNLFAAEVMLRLAESGDNVAGVWGERFLAEWQFHQQDPNAKKRLSHGDCAVVTKDGKIVIFEIINSVSQSSGAFKRLMYKAASWVGVIANSPLDISVVFFSAMWHKDRKDIMNAVRLGALIESRAYAPDTHSREKAISHIGVVSGTWWFPEDGVVSEAATRMTVWQPTTYKFEEFDKPDPKFSTSENRKNVVINTVSALHTPTWIRGDIHDRDFKRE